MYLDASGKATQDSLLGYRASGVPGTVRGLEYAQQEVRQEAVGGAGAPGGGTGVRRAFRCPMRWRNRCGPRARLAQFPESKRIFLNGGKFYEPGDLLVQPDWRARWSASRSTARKDFYEGETARLLAKDMAAHGGLITEDDLKQYAVRERKPLTGTYRGYTIVTAPPPSSGGVGVLQMLGMLEGTGFEKARRRDRRTRGPLHDRGDAPLLRRPLASTSAIPISSRFR